MKTNITRKNFLLSSTLAAAAGCMTDKASAPEVATQAISNEPGIRVRFLGTGAAG